MSSQFVKGPLVHTTEIMLAPPICPCSRARARCPPGRSALRDRAATVRRHIARAMRYERAGKSDSVYLPSTVTPVMRS
jgi:hypothetical protein